LGITPEDWDLEFEGWSHLMFDASSALGEKRYALQAVILKGLGNYYCKQNRHSEAKKVYRDALELFEKVGNMRQMAGCALNIGVAHLHKGEYAKAADLFREAREAYELAGDNEKAALADINLGTAYSSLKDYPKSIELYKKAAAQFEILGLPERVALCEQKLLAVRMKKIRDREEGVSQDLVDLFGTSGMRILLLVSFLMSIISIPRHQRLKALTETTNIG
jgi:tetratricopeptide (TPR) repeat protein